MNKKPEETWPLVSLGLDDRFKYTRVIFERNNFGLLVTALYHIECLLLREEQSSPRSSEVNGSI